MDYSVNPFQELYVADTPSLEHFVKLFSKVPMKSLSVIQPLFQSSNVVLLGTQGCGKTMLLNLLRPEIRIAYYDHKEAFPVEGEAAEFLSAGVNLTKSALPHVAEVSLGESIENDTKQLPYYFGDFFNYLIVKDLFDNIGKITKRPDVFSGLINAEALGHFIQILCRQDCWFGTLNDCTSFEDVQKRIEERIATYRKWVSLNMRIKGAPESLRESKTAIGEPVLRTVSCLKEAKVISDSLPVFIRIDQLEVLHQQPPGHKADLLLSFRRFINTAIGRRDLRVSYRVGTRRWGWDVPDYLTVHGTGGRLEERRDYIQIDLDDVLRRKEHKKGLFETFAADAFLRRINFYLHPKERVNVNLVQKVFGKSPTKRERADYFGKSRSGSVSVETALGLEGQDESDAWSAEWRNFLTSLYETDPLEAVLAAAWGRQRGGVKSKKPHRDAPPPKAPYPWNKVWWRKERMAVAVLQLAARRQQRLLWSGYSDIFALSGGNISAFVHLCHEIWDEFLKEERPKDEKERRNPLQGEAVDKLTQAVAIQNASSVWYRKLAEQPGGDVRRRFVERLGSYLRKRLRDDKPMSYPGGNGFSLSVAELQEPTSPNKEIWMFLREAVGFGDLVALAHTTKEKSGKERIKFFLSPILSPAFQIPVAHTKEPLYWKVGDVLRIAREAELPFMYSTDVKVPSEPIELNVNQLKLL